MKDTSSLSVSSEVLLAVGSKLLMAAIGFGGIIIFANVLGDVGLGEYRTVLAAAFVLAQLPVGTSIAIKKRVSEVDVDPPEYLGVGLLVHGAFSVLVVAAFLLFESVLTPYFGSVLLTYGVVAIIVTKGLFAIFNRLHSGIGYPAVASWIDFARSVLTFALQLVGIWLGLEAFGLVLGLASATLVTVLLSAYTTRVVPAVPGRATLRRVYDFARWSVPNSFLTNFYASVDVLIIRSFVGAGPVGVYTVALNLTIPAAMFAESIRDALSVKSSGVDSIGGEVRQDLENALSYAGLVAIPIFFGALAMPNTLLTTLFGQSFSDAPGLAVVGLALYQLFNVYRHPFEAVIEGTNRPELIFRINLALVLAHLPLALALGHVYGLLGVIASTVVTEAVRVVVYEFVAQRLYGGVIFTRPIAEQFAAGAVMFLVVEYATRLVDVANWLWLVGVVGVGAGLYFLTLVAVSPHFRETARDAIPWSRVFDSS